jgi:ACT domain-containing protein
MGKKKFLDRRWLFTATEAVENLRISSATFYKYKRLLGVEPLKKPGCRCRWYRAEDLIGVLEAVYTPQRKFKLYTQLKKDGFYDEQK